jgi:hypothetical protein
MAELKIVAEFKMASKVFIFFNKYFKKCLLMAAKHQKILKFLGKNCRTEFYGHFEFLRQIIIYKK